MGELAKKVGKTHGNLHAILDHDRFTVGMLIDLLAGVDRELIIKIGARHFKIVKK